MGMRREASTRVVLVRNAKWWSEQSMGARAASKEQARLCTCLAVARCPLALAQLASTTLQLSVFAPACF